MYNNGAKLLIDDNVGLITRRLRVLFPAFNRKFDNWNAAERQDFRELLLLLNDLPTQKVRSGLEYIRKTYVGRDEPHVDVIISVISSDAGEPKAERYYAPNGTLDVQYSAALERGDWEQMKKLRTLLARDFLQQINTEVLAKPTLRMFA